MDINSTENDDAVDVHELSDDEEEVDMENIEEATDAVAVNDLDFIAEHAATEWNFSVIAASGLQGAELPEQLMVVDDPHDDGDDSSEGERGDEEDAGAGAGAGAAAECSSDSDSDDSECIVDSGGKGKREQWCTEEEVLADWLQPLAASCTATSCVILFSHMTQDAACMSYRRNQNHILSCHVIVNLPLIHHLPSSTHHPSTTYHHSPISTHLTPHIPPHPTQTHPTLTGERPRRSAQDASRGARH